MEKKQELKEQIVKNFKENNNDTNLIIDYAKLFLPKTFIYDDNKMKKMKSKTSTLNVKLLNLEYLP